MSKTGLCLALPALTLPIALLPAQTITPTHHSVAEGTYFSTQPFGSANATGWRYQQIHDDLKGKKLTVRRLAFRRDGTASEEPYMSYSVRMTVLLSTAATTVDTIDSNFNANHGGNKQNVLSNKQVDFRASRTGLLPHPFDYAIVFDQPYSFDGTNGGLCWEVQISQQTNLQAAVWFDAASGQSTNPGAAVAPYGSGCTHTTQRVDAAATGLSVMDWPNQNGTLWLNGTNLAMNGVALGVFGFSRTGYGPFPLPLLFPGSSSEYSGPCYLNVSLDFLVPTGSDQSGSAQATFPIPLDAATMNGVHLRAQMLAIDPATSAAIPLIGTNGVEYNLVAPYDIVPISYNLASSTLAPTGSVGMNTGLVAELR